MNLDFFIVYLTLACLTHAAPVKRGFLSDLFGFGDTTSAAAAAAAAPTTAAVTIPTAAAAAAVAATTTSSTGGFWANLFSPATTTAAAAAAAQAQTPAVGVAAAATPVPPAATTSSSGGFWNNLFGLNAAASTTGAAAAPAATAAPVAAAAVAQTPASGSSGSGGFLSNLFNAFFGGSSSSATPAQTQAPATAAAAPATEVAPATAAAVPATAATTQAADSSSQYTHDSLFDFLFGGLGKPQSSQNQLTLGLSASVGVSASIGIPNNPTPTSVSTASTSQPGAVTTNTFQGGSPGKITGSVNTATATASNGGSTAGATAAAGSYGITYSPYTKGDKCKSAAEVRADLAKLSNYELIRLYSTDCSGIENVMAAMTPSQKIYLGLWNIDPQSVQNGLSEIKTAISQSSQGWGAVHTIAVGNERVNAGAASVAQMQTAVDTARTWLKANAPSYNGYIVTVDTLVAYVSNPQLCQMSDYLAVNSHPYWDGGVEPSNSGPWLQQQISHLQSVCGTSKDVLITETGWPTQGDNFGNCVPSVPNQVAAVKSIVNALGSKVIMFTMYNDYWKDPGPYNVEQHWGLYGDPSE
ncbi:uncharacterized protein LODBEIA_P28010 [Lodderomyces beijingensis]|uniref:Uncharacterized protein n=1 Tax=Lodderomyces beijingensis TaxID=1775926 RepID=A0ABP0ZKA4_9ASCO